MAFGLEVFNASGTKTLSTADRLTKLHSVVEVTATGPITTDTFVSVTGMTDDGTWAAVGDNLYFHAKVSSGGFYYQIRNYTGSYTCKVLILRV